MNTSVETKVLGPVQSVFKYISEGIVALDKAGNILISNPAFLDIYGLQNADLDKLRIQNLFHAADLYKFEIASDRACRLGKESRFKAINKGQNGKTLQTFIKVCPFKIGANEGIVLIIKDNTQREKTEEKLRQMMVEAQAGAIAKSQFIANISHEIRTPMNMIMGYAQLLKSGGEKGGEAESFLDNILRSAEHLLGLIDEVLDISKFDVGSVKLETENFELLPFLKDALENKLRKVEEKGLDFSLEYHLPKGAIINTDPIRFKQIILNLMKNAIKFTERGSVRLNVLLNERNELLFQFIDSGIGIEKDQRKKIFSTFHQADETITRKSGGAGLGLALSKHLAKALSGDVRLRSTELNKGSTFEFCLKGSVLQPQSSFKNLKKAKILLVEDMEENQTLVKHYLRELDCNLQVAWDGEEALRKLEHESFDLILMDIQMPRLDGLAATSILRKKGLKTPIIALTAHSMREDIERCMRSGFNDHLSKPLRSDELILRVKEHCY